MADLRLERVEMRSHSIQINGDVWKKRWQQLSVLCTRGLVKQEAVNLEGKLTANLATEVMLEVYTSIMSLPDWVSAINSLLEALEF